MNQTRRPNTCILQLLKPVAVRDLTQHRRYQVFVSVVLVNGSCDGVVILCDGFQLTRVQAGCMEGWACPGRIAVAACCGCSVLTNWDHQPLPHDVQKIHLPTLGGCDLLV